MSVIQDEAAGVVATPARLEAWAEASKAGDRFVYATRCSLPPGSAGAGYARLLEAKGLVRLARHPVTDVGPAPRVWSYFAERSSVRWPQASDRAARAMLSAPEVDVMAEVEAIAVDTLLPIIKRVAQFGRPCPTNRQMADRAGLAEVDVVSAWAALRALKLIHVAPAPPPTNRLVTILENGWRTGIAA